MDNAPVTILPPVAAPVPVVASLPHSGMDIPGDVARLFTPDHLARLRNTDWHLQELYDFLPALGISVVQAGFSRYVIDPNRPLSEPLFGPYRNTPIYETDTWGDSIYTEPPSRADMEARVEAFYRPYHSALSETLDSVRARFGRVFLLDLHSFMGPLTEDVCLGTGKEGKAQALLPATIDAFRYGGFDPVVNKVFTGGHITRHYGGLPATEAVQVELRYTVYLEEDALDKDEQPPAGGTKFCTARKRLEKIFKDIAKALCD